LPKADDIKHDSSFNISLRNPTGLDQGVVSTFLVVSAAGLAVLVSSVFWGFQMVILAERVVAAVDLAALTAADTHRGLISGSVCENAELILKRVDLALTTCRIVSHGVMVSGQLEMPIVTHRASAIAGEK
jgi:hypothetical protein